MWTNKLIIIYCRKITLSTFLYSDKNQFSIQRKKNIFFSFYEIAKQKIFFSFSSFIPQIGTSQRARVSHWLRRVHSHHHHRHHQHQFNFSRIIETYDGTDDYSILIWAVSLLAAHNALISNRITGCKSNQERDKFIWCRHCWRKAHSDRHRESRTSRMWASEGSVE